MKDNTWNRPGWVDVEQNPQLKRYQPGDEDEQTDEEKALLLTKMETTYMDQQKQLDEEKKRILEQQDRQLTDEQKKELREKLA